MIVSTRRHRYRHALLPQRRADSGDGCADSDAPSVGENIPAHAAAAMAAPDHDDSPVPPHREADNLAQQVEELNPGEMDDESIPETDAADDDDKSGERPAIRRRTYNSVITVPPQRKITRGSL